MASIEGVWAAQDLKVKLFYSQYHTFSTAVLFCLRVKVNPFLNLFEQLATLVIENMDFFAGPDQRGWGKRMESERQGGQHHELQGLLKKKNLT